MNNLVTVVDVRIAVYLDFMELHRKYGSETVDTFVDSCEDMDRFVEVVEAHGVYNIIFGYDSMEDANLQLPLDIDELTERFNQYKVKYPL